MIRNNNRAVSNAVSFILIFGIAFASIAVIFSSGITSLDDFREAEEAQNAERAMFVLDQNVKDIYNENVTGRDVELQLSESQLEISQEKRITISQNGNTIYEERTNTVDYRVDEQRATVYEHGALIRETPAGPIMVEEPPLEIRNDRMLFTVVSMDQVGQTSLVQGGTRLLVFRSDEVGVVSDTTAQNDNITVELETSEQRLDAWESYFDDKEEATVVTTTNDTLGVEIENVQPVIRFHEMTVEIES